MKVTAVIALAFMALAMGVAADGNLTTNICNLDWYGTAARVYTNTQQAILCAAILILTVPCPTCVHPCRNYCPRDPGCITYTMRYMETTQCTRHSHLAVL